MKKWVLHFAVTIMFLFLGLLLPLIPEEFAGYVTMFCPVLFGVILCGILCSTVSAVLLGALTPFLSALIYTGALPDAEAWRLVATFAAAGLFSGVIYGTLKAAFGSGGTGLLSAGIAFGISGIIVFYRAGNTYTLLYFLKETVLQVWPGIFLILIGMPLITALFRKLSIMKALRHEGAVR